MDERPAPAELYAAVVGAALSLSGVIGFFYSSAFGSPGDVEALFGLFDVNGWQNLLHILTGALGLIAFATGAHAARQYAFVAGGFYLMLAVWGFVIGAGHSILGVVPVDAEENLLHLGLGLAGLTVAFGTASNLVRA